MKKLGTISYNIYCNFTNYGSALQTWALHQAIKKLGAEPVLVDYCPGVLADKDPLNPFKNMWDKDEESQKMCELSMPAIRENFYKFDEFYHNRFNRTGIKYTSKNFNDILQNEKLDGFVCGSDTIFCIDEFDGFDDGYFANYDVMRDSYCVSYAASFGDSKFEGENLHKLLNRLNNFMYLGLRESTMVDYLKNAIDIPVKRVVDPTLLLEPSEYAPLIGDKIIPKKYLLLYSRRYNKQMEEFADKLAEENGWEVVEISLRMNNSDKHTMFYEAGVEEFLSLVKNAEYIVTNSFHGAIFGIQFSRPINIFSRSSADRKIEELLDLCGMEKVLISDNKIYEPYTIDYNEVHNKIGIARMESLNFLKREIEGCNK